MLKLLDARGNHDMPILLGTAPANAIATTLVRIKGVNSSIPEVD